MHHTQLQCRVHFSSTINKIPSSSHFFQEHAQDRQNKTEYYPYFLFCYLNETKEYQYLNIPEHTSCANLKKLWFNTTLHSAQVILDDRKMRHL